MTLHEHAQKLWGAVPRLFYLSQAAWGTREDYYNLAYNELRERVNDQSEKIQVLEWDLKQEKAATEYMQPALNRIADALGMKNARYSEIADKAVRVIHEQKVAIDAPRTTPGTVLEPQVRPGLHRRSGPRRTHPAP